MKNEFENQKEEFVSDEALEARENELMEMLTDEIEFNPPFKPNEQRVEQIVHKALFETVVKDTTSFVFTSFGETICGLVGALCGSSGVKSEAIRPSDSK